MSLPTGNVRTPLTTRYENASMFRRSGFKSSASMTTMKSRDNVWLVLPRWYVQKIYIRIQTGQFLSKNNLFIINANFNLDGKKADECANRGNKMKNITISST